MTPVYWPIYPLRRVAGGPHASHDELMLAQRMFVMVLLVVTPFWVDAALEKKVPCWPGFDFTIAPPYGDPQCSFNEANDCGFPPPPLSVQPTKQDADRYTEVVQNQTRSQVTGEVQRSGWQGTGQGSPSPCQASTKSTYNVKRVKQDQVAGKCTVSEKNCKVTIIDSAPSGGTGPSGREAISGDLESARRALLAQLELSVGREATHGDALFAAQALNQLGYAGDVRNIFTRAEETIASELHAVGSLEGIAGGTIRDARADAAVLQARLSALESLQQIAFAPVGLTSTGAGTAGSIGSSNSDNTVANDWSALGRFAPVVNSASALFRTFGSSEQPTLGRTELQANLTLWQRFQAWASDFFIWR